MSKAGSRETAYKAVKRGLEKLRTDDTLADFTLGSGDKEWKVHKVVLFTHSDVLYTMSTSPRFPESQSGRAELKDINGVPFDPACIEALVQYLYIRDEELIWPWSGRRNTSDQCRARDENHADNDSSSDDSELPDVDDVDDAEAEAVVENCATHPISDVDFLISLGNLAEMYNIVPLKRYTMTQLDLYMRCEMPGRLNAMIEHICATDTEPQEMRQLIADYAAAEIGEFHPLKGGILDRHPDFAHDVLEALARRAHEGVGVRRHGSILRAEVGRPKRNTEYESSD
ncbi:hypothetical protein CLAFUW4_07850 [Fulvia fulva]|uniref:BTB domain-containing protein n=1 Tax=Passalora fulva TaxID=5499 RepID=A0A9Q8P6T1_PASFU|nr:uncharacterized protein CLAFUR5_07974 [Fulvia fulva]KAK4628898.1 hypothetical protein CLAFUR4_07855 [Fulvia fulva]KAK4630474.1 hypothetical protein CLAFUR0_07852 [Fulvia fulva]UJO15358.1 hypothetical protein CLAFUR5_07974 [Fulvia fulva]WPV12235.1 hypothetical protein CLAFUW4_07850 [Fulvia fulva]WPV27612.1 hypothetical protein CLAFUW7_07851 [Fulvia fulva]